MNAKDTHTIVVVLYPNDSFLHPIHMIAPRAANNNMSELARVNNDGFSRIFNAVYVVSMAIVEIIEVIFKIFIKISCRKCGKCFSKHLYGLARLNN